MAGGPGTRRRRRTGGALALLAAAAAAPACASYRAPPGPPRPDIVLVLADDQRLDTLGCTGNPLVATPAIDGLAAEGVVFTRALVTTPLCVPSRATLLTGTYPHVHGLLTHGFDEADGEPLACCRTLPELLQEVGYETAFFGKWHLPLGADGRARGFDHWESFEDQGVYFRQPLAVDGELVATDGHLTDALARRAADWLRRRRRGPAFAIVSLKAPHTPYMPPFRDAGTLADAAVELPASRDDPLDSLPPHHAARRPARPFSQRYGDEKLRADVRAYLEMIPSIDDCVGTLRRALWHAGRLHDATIWVTSDHGLLHGEHGMRFKRVAFEPCVRVPLVAWGVDVPEGVREDRPALLLDLAPTFLELASAPPAPQHAGRSLLELWRGPAPGWRTSTLHLEPGPRDDPLPEALVLRTASWKYLAFRGPEGPGEAFYDLARDPDERRCLAAGDLPPDALDTLRAELRRVLDEADVPAAWREHVGLAPRAGAPASAP